MKKQKLQILFGFALFSQAWSLRTTPSFPQDADIVRELTSYLENRQPSSRQDDDDDETRRPIFPGVAQILLGVATGDIRRVIENGVFSFLPKSAQTHAFAFFHNIVGTISTTPNSTTTTTATTPKGNKTRTTQVTKGLPTVLDQTVSTTLRRKSTLKYHRVTRIPTYTIKSRTTFTLTPSTASTSETTIITTPEETTEAGEIVDPDPDPEPDPEPDEDGVVSRFEEALRPYLPANPDDALPQDTPQFI